MFSWTGHPVIRMGQNVGYFDESLTYRIKDITTEAEAETCDIDESVKENFKKMRESVKSELKLQSSINLQVNMIKKCLLRIDEGETFYGLCDAIKAHMQQLKDAQRKNDELRYGDAQAIKNCVTVDQIRGVRALFGDNGKVEAFSVYMYLLSRCSNRKWLYDNMKDVKRLVVHMLKGNKEWERSGWDVRDCRIKRMIMWTNGEVITTVVRR